MVDDDERGRETDPGRAAGCLAAKERGYLSDEDLLRALEDISRREWPPGRKDPVTQELDVTRFGNSTRA